MNFPILSSLILLPTIGAIFAGMAFKVLFIGHEIAYEFWGQSIKFRTTKHRSSTNMVFVVTAYTCYCCNTIFLLFISKKHKHSKWIERNE